MFYATSTERFVAESSAGQSTIAKDCTCYELDAEGYECRCNASTLMDVPSNLPRSLLTLWVFCEVFWRTIERRFNIYWLKKFVQYFLIFKFERQHRMPPTCLFLTWLWKAIKRKRKFLERIASGKRTLCFWLIQKEAEGEIKLQFPENILDTTVCQQKSLDKLQLLSSFFWKTRFLFLQIITYASSHKAHRSVCKAAHAKAFG